MSDVRVRPSRLPWWLELPVLFVVYQAFEWVRSQVTGAAGPAQRNARLVVSIERATWTFHELRVQHLFLGHRVLVEGLNIYYGTVHFVGPPLVLLWLWRRCPADYARWRNTLAIATGLGLACFWLIPLAPPRLLEPLSRYGFVDTARVVGGLGPLDAGNFKDTNPYAAMPSLHVAWSTWCAAAFAFAGVRRRAKLLAFLYPLATLIVVMATGNHFFLDAVGGWIVLAAGWWLAGLGRSSRHAG